MNQDRDRQNFSGSDPSYSDEYTSFAQALRSVSADDIDPLDSENGPAIVWRSVCQSKLENPLDLSPGQREFWMLERNTWQLVQMLYTQRTTGPQSPDQALLSNPYLPPLNVVNANLARSKELLELSTIRDWLHTCPAQTHPAEIRRGYWPYTKSSIKHSIQKNQPSLRNDGSDKSKSTLIRSLDPDAPLRPINPEPNPQISSDPLTLPQTTSSIDRIGQLDQLDQEYDRAMVRTLYEYVRAGEIGLALDFCRQCDHPWRAASLSGGRLFYDRALSYPEPGSAPFSNDDQMDFVNSLDGTTSIDSQSSRSGCLSRKLWKSMCCEMSSNKLLPTYEQALYGALAGEVTPVLPVCNTWEDHIWCHINSIFEKEVDRILESSLTGYYWSHGSLPPHMDQDEGTVIEALDNKPQPDIKLAMNSAFDKVLRSENPPLAESARNPFHVAQMWLAIDKINDLLGTFASGLQSADDITRENFSHLLRFFSHLALFLRLIGEKVDSDAANAIIRAYVHVLELENKHDLIAFYVSELQEESGVETYARYLISLGPEADRQTRRVALLRALEHRLDLSRVACTAVQLTLQEIIEKPVNLDEDDEDEDALQRLNHQITDKQRYLIRSLEWLTIDSMTYRFALTQGNFLTRYFLASGHPNAARQVIRSFPPDLLSRLAKEKEGTNQTGHEEEGGVEDERDDEVLEFTQYREFFNCLELHVQVNEVLCQRPVDGAPKAKFQAFIQPLGQLCDRFYDSVVEILTSEWLQGIKSETHMPDNAESIRGNSNKKGLVRDPEKDRKLIRKMYIPELIFRVHGSLVESGQFIPNNLRKALELSGIIADESYQNYLEFLPSSNNSGKIKGIGKVGQRKQQHKMKDYLKEVRSLVLLILEKSGNNPLKPIIA